MGEGRAVDILNEYIAHGLSELPDVVTKIEPRHFPEEGLDQLLRRTLFERSSSEASGTLGLLKKSPHRSS